MPSLVALVLAVMLIAALAVPAMAEDPTYTITLPNSLTGATYDIYQILTGTYNKDDNGETLSNVHWGSSTNSTAALTENELKAITDLTGKSETEIATALNAYITGSAVSNGTQVAGGTKVTVPAGYYLIRETLPTGDAAQKQEQSLYVVKVVGNVTITRKASTTESDKTVTDKNDSNATEATSNATGTSSDYDIGDFVPYHVEATISEKVGQYKKYHITLEDILESGKFDEIKLTKTDLKLGTAAIEDTEDYTVTTTWNTDPTKTGFKVTVEFTPKEGKDLSSLVGKKIQIDFSAKLGTGAAIGSAGNKNTLKVSYSNNPNSTDGKEEGHTPDKEVITFTYKVVINKVDENEKPLGGAQFALYKVASTYTLPTSGDAKSKGEDAASKKIQDYTAAVTASTEGKNDTFTFKGIDDGRYVLVETTTPDGYNTADPQVFDVVATHEGVSLTALNGTKVSGEIKLQRDFTDEDALKAAIKNQKGSTLPSTGGIGTTIFYVAGSILVLAAAILLITKRRMGADD